MNEIDANLVIEKLLEEDKRKSYKIAVLEAQLETVQNQLLQEVRKDVKDDTQ